MEKFKNVINRMRGGEDLGLDRSVASGRQNSINKDGTYNVERKTGKLFGNFQPYHWIITISWTRYLLVLISFYVIMNIAFASVYFIIGTQELSGILGNTAFEKWLSCFFFSAQTFTTVGFGGIHPTGIPANFVATLEAFIGLMTFALATGTLYGRFSKPVSKIQYSDKIIIAPFKGGTALQFMVANQLNSSLVEMEAKVILSWTDTEDVLKNGSNATRKFQQVALEVDKIAMFPFNWIINHPIDEESELYGKKFSEIQERDFEVFVLLKGFDDVFSQTIYSRKSYQIDSFIYGAKFKKPFYINSKGLTVLDLTQIGMYDEMVLE